MLQRLKKCLDEYGISQAELARAVGISGPSMCRIMLRGEWPRRTRTEALQENIRAVLAERDVPRADMKDLFENPDAERAGEPQEDEIMLLSRQTLFRETKQHFKLFCNPFSEDMRSSEDVFLSADIRYVRESMFNVAKNGGFLALVGESGSGKSTLRRDLIARLAEEAPQVVVIEPYVLGMEDSDKKGKTLKSSHIAEAIMDRIAPTEVLASSSEARFRQVHRSLLNSARGGQSHVLIMEEAHGLAIPVLKHLKRFWELEDGFRRLLSIILIGQPELQAKLARGNYQVREVVQRCEVVELRPLGKDLQAYIQFKLTRAGIKDTTAVISDEGVEALRERLTGPVARRGGREVVSLCYPLVVGNMMIAAMNVAAEIGVPQVNPDVIRQV